MRVAVGLSGGVDSSVAAALLKEAGHEVVGVTMKLWKGGPCGSGTPRDACFGPGEEQDMERAAAFCRSLGIEYRTFDCADAYEREILAYFREAYRAGLTPNPCVRCNAAMKFGLLPRLARESGLDFDKFATGHYARVEERDGAWRLLRGKDPKKDQSYFLYRLSQEQLAGVLFPLGGLTKAEVRAEARRRGLAAAELPDSQDFYGGEYAELLGMPPREGKIVDTSGRVLGTHRGYWNYTVGQRKGLGIGGGRKLYVLGVDACRNEVTVGGAEETRCAALRIADESWVAGERPDDGPAQCKIRSASAPLDAEWDGASQTVRFAPPGAQGAAPGQSAVLYRGDEVLGGGVIAEAR